MWAYFDRLLTNRAGASDGPAWSYSIAAGRLPNPAHGGGGPGTRTSGSINVKSGADPYPVLDPQVTIVQICQQGDQSAGGVSGRRKGGGAALRGRDRLLPAVPVAAVDTYLVLPSRHGYMGVHEELPLARSESVAPYVRAIISARGRTNDAAGLVNV